jgi:hypothetical protein
MVEILIPYVLGSLAVGAVVGWVAKALADDTTVYDTAGNVFDAELVPDPHTDLIVNTMSPLGFLAVQLRLSGDYANDRGILDDAGRALDASVESLKKDLTPCADCGQINGNHRVTCAGWGDMLKMDWRSKEPMDESTDKDNKDAEG